MIKFFNLQKNKFKKEGSTMPDYKISVNLGDKDKANYAEAGACWIKKDSKGNTFLSCKLSDAYVDHTKGTARKGFTLIAEGETETVKTYAPKVEEGEAIEENEDIPF